MFCDTLTSSKHYIYNVAKRSFALLFASILKYKVSDRLCNPLPSFVPRGSSTVARGGELECVDVRRKSGRTRAHEALRARGRSARLSEDRGDERRHEESNVRTWTVNTELRNQKADATPSFTAPESSHDCKQQQQQQQGPVEQLAAEGYLRSNGSSPALRDQAPPSLRARRLKQPRLLQMDSSGETARPRSGHAEPRSGHAEPRSGPGRTDLRGLYHLGRTLGRGHFAVVKLARHVDTGDLVAVKMIDKTKLDVMATSHLLQEVRCMRLVQHPNVVRLYEVIDTPTTLYLVMELAEGGDLFDYIIRHEGGVAEDTAKRHFAQIVRAVAYCHRLHVVHRDLKPENVVFFPQQGVVKLTDFGFSNLFQPGTMLATSCGSLAYSAPEILLGEEYDAPAVGAPVPRHTVPDPSRRFSTTVKHKGRTSTVKSLHAGGHVCLHPVLPVASSLSKTNKKARKGGPMVVDCVLWKRNLCLLGVSHTPSCK
ncbi:hypothetical protein fugu_012235 [Takifugu bimaculatus]|uniref:non-specific serine/threonine protein kinase n=1 Tax=Takifugu bimaculatus TaxID=433685 RepID=A0A4Z2C9Y5_9TELE|nr:hypothetical protein fugu_012235 [Takifugu bimaculatus]